MENKPKMTKEMELQQLAYFLQMDTSHFPSNANPDLLELGVLAKKTHGSWSS